MKPYLVITGMTGSGKSSLATWLSSKLGLDVMIADTLQINEGLPLLTNKPTPDQIEKAKYHMVNRFKAGEYSLGKAVQESRKLMLSLNKPLIIEGGSPFYLQQLFNPALLGVEKGIEDQQGVVKNYWEEAYKFADAYNNARLYKIMWSLNDEHQLGLENYTNLVEICNDRPWIVNCYALILRLLDEKINFGQLKQRAMENPEN